MEGAVSAYLTALQYNPVSVNEYLIDLFFNQICSRIYLVFEMI